MENCSGTILLLCELRTRDEMDLLLSFITTSDSDTLDYMWQHLQDHSEAFYWDTDEDCYATSKYIFTQEHHTNLVTLENNL